MRITLPQEIPQDQLASLLNHDMVKVNSLIKKRMASDAAPRIPEVTEHLIDAGGKRLRPLLTLAAAKMCGNTSPYHIHLAATVEFIHTATLLHDDVVDESKQRRGRPTANLLWDNQSSVLVGDYLFSRSFQLMVETGNLRVLDILANASATIAEGEVLQLTVAQNLSTTEDTYLKVIRGKTAALFGAACKVGGVISNAEEKIIDALASYGDALGVCFQITDDLLDYNGSSADLGKSIGDDFRERKMSLPLIKVLKKSDVTEKEFWKRTIEKGDQQDDDLDFALKLMTKHNALEDTHNDAKFWAEKAKKSISILPKSKLRNILTELPDFVVNRLS